MKKYLIPETACLNMQAQSIICASGEDPNPPIKAAQLQPSVKQNGSW